MPDFNLQEESKFIQACVEGDTAKLQLLFEQDKTLVNVRATNGYTPLMFAAQNGHMAVLKWLIGKGAEIHAINHEQGAHQGKTAMWFAALGEPSDWDIVLELLKAGSKDLDATPDILKSSTTVMRIASMSGQWDVVLELFKADAKNLAFTAGTAVYYASVLKAWNILLELLNMGAENIDDYGFISHETPLYNAITEGEREVAEALLARGASMDLRPTSLLKLSEENINNQIQQGNYDNLHKFVAVRQILNAAEALFTFAENKTGTLEELNSALTILGAAINAFKKNKTVLQIAIENQHPLLVPLLIAKGANLLDKEGNCLFTEGEFALPEIELKFEEKQMINAFAKLEWVKSLLKQYNPIDSAKVSTNKSSNGTNIEAKEDLDVPPESEDTLEISMVPENSSKQKATFTLDDDSADLEIKETQENEEVITLTPFLTKLLSVADVAYHSAHVLEEPLRSEFLFKLGTPLHKALPLPKPLTIIMLSSLGHVQSDANPENYKKACALLAELYMLVDPIRDSGSKALGNPGEIMEKRLFYTLASQDPSVNHFLASTALSFVTGGNSINGISGTISGMDPRSSTFFEILKSLKKQFDISKKGQSISSGLPESHSSTSSSMLFSYSSPSQALSTSSFASSSNLSGSTASSSSSASNSSYSASTSASASNIG